MRQEDDKGGPQDTGKAQEPEGSAEKAGSKKDKYQKAQAKAERAGEKLGKAREKLDKVEAKRAARQRRSRRGLQKRQSGEPVQKHGSMSTTRYTRSSMKMWVWKEPINPSWPQRPEPGN